MKVVSFFKTILFLTVLSLSFSSWSCLIHDERPDQSQSINAGVVHLVQNHQTNLHSAEADCSESTFVFTKPSQLTRGEFLTIPITNYPNYRYHLAITYKNSPKIRQTKVTQRLIPLVLRC